MRYVALSVLVASASVLFGESLAGAQPSAVELRWDAPQSCPTAEDLRARIAARLMPTDVLPNEIRVKVEDAESGFRVQMSTDGAERSFVAPTCEDAATAVAVIVALAAQARAEEKRAALAPAIDAPAPPLVLPAEAPPPAPTGRRVLFSASFGAAVDGASLPSASPGFVLGVEARRGLGALALRGAVFLPQTERASGDPPVAASIALADLLGLACLALRLSPNVDFAACAGGGAGIMPASSDGIDHPRSAFGWRPEIAALGRVDVRASELFGVFVEPGLIVDPVRSPFRVTGVGDVYRPPILAPRLSGGLALRFQ